MNRRNFTFELRDEVIRGMNRQQYKVVSHYLRWAARHIDFAIDWDKFREHVCDILLYGQSKYCFEDLLK